jgi:homoserine dehydrogenase
MGAAGISLESVIQRPDLRVSEPGVTGTDTRTVVLLTHSTMEQTVRDALAAIRSDGFIVGDPQMIRIEQL